MSHSHSAAHAAPTFYINGKQLDDLSEQACDR